MRKVLLQIANVEFFLGYMVYTLIDLDSWSIIAFAAHADVLRAL